MKQHAAPRYFLMPMGGALRWMVCSLVFVTGIAGCSDNSGKSTHETPAKKICDSSLDGSAAAALNRIAGTEDFTELTGKNDAGEPNRFSLKLATKHLHETTPERNTCAVYKAGDKSGHPLIEVDFEASVNHPDARHPAKSDDNTLYPIGVYASTSGNFAASLFFRCPTTGEKGHTPYVKASMYSSGDQLEGNSTGKARMVILNAISRSLAAELKCADKAKLPPKVPEPMAP